MGSRLIVCVSVVVLAAICAWDLRDTPAAPRRASTATSDEMVTRRDAPSHKRATATTPVTTTPVDYRASP